LRVSYAASPEGLALLAWKQQAGADKDTSDKRRVGQPAVKYSAVLTEMLKQTAARQLDMYRLGEFIAGQRKVCADLKDKQQAAKETYGLLNQKLRDYKAQYNVPGTTDEEKEVLMTAFNELHKEVIAKRDEFCSIENQREALKIMIVIRENQRTSLRAQIQLNSQSRQHMEVAMARKLDLLTMLPLTKAASYCSSFLSASTSRST
jgi:hypothetical protein